MKLIFSRKDQFHRKMQIYGTKYVVMFVYSHFRKKVDIVKQDWEKYSRENENFGATLGRVKHWRFGKSGRLGALNKMKNQEIYT